MLLVRRGSRIFLPLVRLGMLIPQRGGVQDGLSGFLLGLILAPGECPVDGNPPPRLDEIQPRRRGGHPEKPEWRRPRFHTIPSKVLWEERLSMIREAFSSG